MRDLLIMLMVIVMPITITIMGDVRKITFMQMNAFTRVMIYRVMIMDNNNETLLITVLI